MDPQQELFTALLMGLKELEYDVYDGFLPDDAPYPFLYLADSQTVDDVCKGGVMGNVYQTIHIWHNNPTKRGTVSAMLLAVKTVCRGIDHTSNFTWILRNADQRILTDTTTKTPLLHGVLEVEFKFC